LVLAGILKKYVLVLDSFSKNSMSYALRIYSNVKPEAATFVQMLDYSLFSLIRFYCYHKLLYKSISHLTTMKTVKAAV